MKTKREISQTASRKDNYITRNALIFIVGVENKAKKPRYKVPLN